MPSYTSEQKDTALKALEEYSGSVTRAMRMLGYPSRQTFYSWINERDALHQRTAGRPFSHYDPALKREAVHLVRGGWPNPMWHGCSGSRAPSRYIIGHVRHRSRKCRLKTGGPSCPTILMSVRSVD